MDHQKLATMSEVQSTFAAWKTVNDQIKALQQAVDPHLAAGTEPPQALESKLRELQIESERLLLIASQALLKIKTPRSSNGDSTWG